MEKENSRIEIVGMEDQRVWPFIQQVPMASRALLFGWDRLRPVEFVGLALDDEGSVIGLATLAPTDESGEQPRPTIIGVWVVPAHRKQGVGPALMKALSQQCLESYKMAPTADAVSVDGLKLCRRCVDAGIQLEYNNGVLLGMRLP